MPVVQTFQIPGERLNYPFRTILNLSVVIVNFRTPGMVIDCLVTLLPELENIDARVIIVDNNSGDDSYDRIQEWAAKNDNNSVVHNIK